MTRRSPSRKVTYFDPIRPRLTRQAIAVPLRLARHTVIETTFDVGAFAARCASIAAS